ncbi:MAG: hypothetical protein HDR82_02365 [Bacteroides sp.]|nr:hypothetical protein [Bacteroides sp.]
MKQIYTIIFIVTAVILLNATSPYLTAYYFRQNKQYRDSIDNLPSGNYFAVQPGLYEIANQMSEDEGRAKKNKDSFSPLGAYPILLNFVVKDIENHIIDTFQYNWKNDIIICINCVNIATGEWCELISSKDSLLALDDFPGVVLRRNLKTELTTNAKYFNAVKNWDKVVLDSICRTDARICSGNNYSVSRLTIKDGKLVDVKMIKCNYIDSKKN